MTKHPPSHWRARARQFRDLADQQDDPQAKREMMDLAGQWDDMAATAENDADIDQARPIAEADSDSAARQDKTGAVRRSD